MTVHMWSSISSNELSVCRHCHPADGAFDLRDHPVCTIYPNVLNCRGEQRSQDERVRIEQACRLDTCIIIIKTIPAMHDIYPVCMRKG